MSLVTCYSKLNAKFLRASALAAVSVAWCAPGTSRAEDVQLLDRPAYKLYTICSKKIDATPEDIQLLAHNFTLMHGKMSRAEFEAIRAVNPDFKCLAYVNSTYTRSVDEAVTVESKYRRGICMHLSAQLGDAITADQTTFAVKPAASSEADASEGRHGAEKGGIAIRASTVSGNVSSDDDAKPSTKNFVFWIRIDDELMRVNAFDPATGRIEVLRGIEATKPVAHSISAHVFSPVYLGYQRADKDKHPGTYPGGPGTRIRYVMDPSEPVSHQYLSEIILRAMEERHTDGVWLDTCNVGDFNVSDCQGRHIRAWDFTKGRPYGEDDFRLGQEKKMNALQQIIKEKLHKEPVLVANNMQSRTYYPGHGGMSLLLRSTEVKPRPIDGFCMEGGLAAKDEESWAARIQIIMDAAQNGLAAMPILGGAGAESFESEPDTAQRDQVERFGYASYLLGVEKDGKTLMGTYAFYRQGEKRFVKVHRQYFYPIGAPSESLKPAEFEKYRMPNSSVYRRTFTNGVVLVNPSEKDSAMLDLGSKYLDPDSGEVISSIMLPGHSGKILLTKGKP